MKESTRTAYKFKKTINQTQILRAQSPQETLEKLRQFLLYEQRLSPYNAQKVLARVKHIIKTYNTTFPNLELAHQIQDDLRSKNRSVDHITQTLWAIKYWAKSNQIELEIKMPKRTKRKVDYLSLEESKQLLEAANDIREKAIIAILLGCGLRNKELIALKTMDVDLQKRIIYIRDHGQGIKNREENTVIMPKWCKIIVKEYIDNRPQCESQNLFITIYGGNLTQNWLEKLVAKVAKRAGIKKRVYPHLLRHTCGTQMMSAGINLALVQRQLRQRDIHSTMIYLHPDEDTLRQNIDKSYLLM